MLSTNTAGIDNVEPFNPIKETFGILPTKVTKNAMVSKKRNSCVRWRTIPGPGGTIGMRPA